MESAIFGLIGVVVGAVLTTVKEWWFQSKNTKKDAEYLAIQVSCALERYVAACAEVATDNGLSEWYEDDFERGAFRVKTPAFDADSLEVEWKALPGTLMYEVLDFPYRAELVGQRLAEAFEFSAPPDQDLCFEERQYQYAILGIAASELVKKLRQHAGLTARSSG